MSKQQTWSACATHAEGGLIDRQRDAYKKITRKSKGTVRDNVTLTFHFYGTLKVWSFLFCCTERINETMVLQYYPGTVWRMNKMIGRVWW